MAQSEPFCSNERNIGGAWRAGSTEPAADEVLPCSRSPLALAPIPASPLALVDDVCAHLSVPSGDRVMVG
eukprot:2381000-Rhodomonas_salina.1